MCNRVCAPLNYEKHMIVMLIIVVLFHVFSWKTFYYLQTLINNTRIKISSVLHVYTNFKIKQQNTHISRKMNRLYSLKIKSTDYEVRQGTRVLGKT